MQLVGLPGACPALFKPPKQESVFCLGHGSGQLGWNPSCEGIFLLFVSWLIPFHTKMSHPLGIGYSGGGKYKSCFLGGLCYINNTLNVFLIPQQNFGTSLLHEQGYNAEVLGVKLVL